jgi:hypothetical protein
MTGGRTSSRNAATPPRWPARSGQPTSPAASPAPPTRTGRRDRRRRMPAAGPRPPDASGTRWHRLWQTSRSRRRCHGVATRRQCGCREGIPPRGAQSRWVLRVGRWKRSADAGRALADVGVLGNTLPRTGDSGPVQAAPQCCRRGVAIGAPIAGSEPAEMDESSIVRKLRY